MKRLYNLLGLAACLMISMAFPQRVHAAGTDAITLEQQADKVSVTVNMSNANKEQITAISLSLKVETDGGNAQGVTFTFSPALESAVKDFRYDKDRGILGIYVASADPIFDSNDSLNVGSVGMPANAPAGLKALVSVVDQSMNTVNKAYGSKTPDIAYDEIKTVTLEVKPSGGNEEKPDGGQDQPGGSQNQNGGGQDSGNNTSSGLYDNTTQFVNDPKAAEKIPSGIINKGDLPGLPWLDPKTAGHTAPVKVNLKSGSNGVQNGRVTVIDPKDGPSGILVSEGNSETGAKEQTGAPEGVLQGEKAGENGKGAEEILLDQENGGVQGENPNSRKASGLRTVMIVVLAAAGVGAVAGAVVLIRKNNLKKRRMKRRRKSNGKNSGKR